jgi:SAM-dependent methyltransferase
MFDYDAELSRYQARLHAAADVQGDDHVLDIGCGAGLTTCEAAGLAVRGSALGVDLSDAMLAHARRRAERERIRNVDFERADAQVHPFPPARFSLGISRFGTMFFSDPVAAFTNVGRALRPGARLVQLVWQAGDRQEWHRAIRAALGDRHAAAVRAAVDPFSLADPAVTAGVLTAAGFTSVDVTDVREPIYYGPDAAGASEAVLGLHMTRARLAGLDAAAAERALARLRATFEAHDTGDGVWFDSRAWLVTAVLRRSD